MHTPRGGHTCGWSRHSTTPGKTCARVRPRRPASRNGTRASASGPGPPLASFVRDRCDEYVRGIPGADLVSELLGSYVSGGKYVRPTFTYLGWLCGADESDAALRAAASTELLHAFALIQDDVMDRSVLRRGRATAHVRLADWYGSRRPGGRRAALRRVGRDLAQRPAAGVGGADAARERPQRRRARPGLAGLRHAARRARRRPVRRPRLRRAAPAADGGGAGDEPAQVGQLHRAPPAGARRRAGGLRPAGARRASAGTAGWSARRSSSGTTCSASSASRRSPASRTAATCASTRRPASSRSPPSWPGRSRGRNSAGSTGRTGWANPSLTGCASSSRTPARSTGSSR